MASVRFDDEMGPLPSRADGPLWQQFERERMELLALFRPAAQVFEFPKRGVEESLDLCDLHLNQSQPALLVGRTRNGPPDLHTRHGLKALSFFGEVVRKAHGLTLSRWLPSVKPR